MIEIKDVSFTYESGESENSLRNINLKIKDGETVLLCGESGCGKTTLMKIIDGRIKPDSGTVTIGQTIKIGYYTQEIETDQQGGIAYMDPQEKVIDYIKNTAEFVRTEDGLVSASTMLEKISISIISTV